MLGAGMAVLAGILAINWGFGLLFGESGIKPRLDRINVSSGFAGRST
jgi:hypothetical protein